MEKILLAQLPEFAQKILEKIEHSDRSSGRSFILALHGDLGAGKTTFVQALAKALEIEDVVQSPTYVLMKSYDVPLPPAGGWLKKLIHIDAYRLDDPQEFKTLKPEEFLSDASALVVVEWPERAGNLLPKPDLTINFSSEDASEGERFVEVL